MLRLRAAQILEQFVGPDEVNAGALLDGAQAEGDRQVRLADAGRPEQEDIGGLGDEGEGGEVPDLALVDRRLEAKVELLERAVKRQVRQARAGAQVALPPGGRLRTQQVGEEVGVRQLLLGGGLQATVEDGGGFGEAEVFQVLAGLRGGDHRTVSRSRS